LPANKTALLREYHGLFCPADSAAKQPQSQGCQPFTLLLGVDRSLLEVRQPLIEESPDPGPADPNEEDQDRDGNCPHDEDRFQADGAALVPMDPLQKIPKATVYHDSVPYPKHTLLKKLHQSRINRPKWRLSDETRVFEIEASSPSI